MNLTPELIEHAKKEIDIEQYYEPAEKVTAQHILFADFIAATKWKGLPKIIFYCVINDVYGMPEQKDAKGLLGYPLRLKSTVNEQPLTHKDHSEAGN